MEPLTEVMPYGLELVGAQETVIGSKDRPQSLTVPALQRHNGEIITRWELTPEEMKDVLRTGNLYLTQPASEQEACPPFPQTETDFLAAFGYQLSLEVKKSIENLEVLRLLRSIKPIDMILPCPKCGKLHIDAPEPENGWDNPPHKSHLCHGCGHIFRPADVPTNGVAVIKTRGENDSPIPVNSNYDQQTQGSSKA